jgi:bifunctional non-homologous end joining protein LigD
MELRRTKEERMRKGAAKKSVGKKAAGKKRAAKKGAAKTNVAKKLAKYRSMRDFGLTREPSGAAAAPSSSGRSFVVQKHDARRLHYDFRLELDGVLKSWAVPKGPSLDPKEKHLAVETEDHPLDYRDFEGEIPAGEYGGGPVIVWDRGDWEPVGDPREGLAKGHLELTLSGEKLRGRFMLVRLKSRDEKKTNWLLMKRADEHAREGKAADVVAREPRSVLTGRTIDEVARGVPANRGSASELPKLDAIAPELATLVDEVPSQAGWIYELKYDGYRIVASVDHGEVRLASRNGKDWTGAFPEIAGALSRVRARTLLLDGEVAYVAEDGRTDFQSLQNAMSAHDRSRILYFPFDLLHFDGVDLRKEPLAFRKDKLRTVLAGEGPPLRMSDDVSGDGEAFFRRCCEIGLEGIIAKRADRPYVSGRTRDWVKVKCQKRQELVVVGFTPPKGSRAGLGALLLGVREGGRLRYAGKVGTGFTRRSLEDLTKRLAKLTIDAPKVQGAPRIRDVTWVKPELVCEVRFTEWTRDGSLRHPSFEGLREDKSAREVVREEEKPMARPRSKKAPDAALTVGRVTITHPDRVVDPSTGLTKADLARYHEAMADRILPYASKRPLMLLRCRPVPSPLRSGAPGNASKKTCFVQKHSGRGLVKNVGKGDAAGEEVLFVTKPDELFELVQLSTVELHGWGSRMPRWDRPDWVVFDLDPDEGVAWKRVVDCALHLRDELARLDLESFVKTTGGKGLHVVVPIRPASDWETVSHFAEVVVNGLVRAAPRELVATMSKAARKDRIFVDRFRNAKGATAVLPYSPRIREGLTVATPVAWRDLARLDPRELTIETVPRIVARRRVDPWAELLEVHQTLPRRLKDVA